MKFTAAVVGAGALCAGTDAFVAVAPVTGSFAVSRNSVFASSSTSAPAARVGEVVMSLGDGGSKKGGIPRSLSSKISSVFRGNTGRG